MEPDPTQMMAQMGKKLDLSAEQQSEVEGLLASAKQASAADQKRMHELRVEMKGMRDNFDAEKARKLADEIGKVTGRLVYQASATWSGVYQLLNAEQKAELDSMMAQRGERHGKWREGGERPSQ
jgi:Spy/CpxP family protein refolding chaperone